MVDRREPLQMEWLQFHDYLTGLGLDERTIAYYVRHCRKAQAWLRTQGSELETCRAATLAEWASSLPNSHSSRGQVAAALTHYWEAIERANPPTKAIRVPPRMEMVCRTLEPNETRGLVKVALGWWPQGTAVLAGLYLALRRFEIAKMEWERFDDELKWYRVTGKRSKTATLPVHPVLRSELAPHQAEGWVFVGLRGHVNPATVWEWVELVARSAGVRNLTPHRLRHTALAWAVDAGKPLRDVQSFARHSDPGMTAKYTRTTTRRLEEVVDALDYV
jgi:integrase